MCSLICIRANLDLILNYRNIHNSFKKLLEIRAENWFINVRGAFKIISIA